MQIPSVNPVLQSLSGAQEAGAQRAASAATRTETVRAIGQVEQADPSKQDELRTKRETEDDNNTAPKPRGSLVDIVV